MLRVPLFILFALALPAADPVYESARRKLDLIEGRQAKPGSVIVFTPDEINAWTRVSLPGLVPEGIRNSRIELGVDIAAGYALVDFLELRHSKGVATNPLVAKLIEGERPLRATIRVESSAGRCTVHLTRVEVSNVVAKGQMLAFLINTFFLPLYPDAKIDEPFDLDYNIDRIDIQPSGVRVAIKK
jgi:hypothetical protein